MSENIKVGIVGTGQVGTALTSELTKIYPHDVIYATDTNPAVAPDYYRRLRELGADSLDNVHHVGPLVDGHLHEGMKGLDLAGLAVTGEQQEAAVTEIAPYLKPGSIIFDVCSNKTDSIKRIMQAIKALNLPFEVAYVPFHILNGFAGDGPLSAKADILKAAGVIVPGVAPSWAEDILAAYLEPAGTQIFKMLAPAHDEVLATTSQHEYMAMFAFADCDFIKNMPLGSVDPGRWMQAMLRIIDASPNMWASNFLDSRNWDLKAADRFRPILSGIKIHLHDVDQRIDRAHAFARQMPSRNTEAFDLTRYDGQDLSVSAFSAVLSLALTENIMTVSDQTSVYLPDKINPSAKDGMACMNDPDMAKYLIKENIKVLPPMISQYLSCYTRCVKLIADLPFPPKREGNVIVDPEYQAMCAYVAGFKGVDKHLKLALAARSLLVAPKSSLPLLDR